MLHHDTRNKGFYSVAYELLVTKSFLQGGQRADVVLGLNFIVQHGLLAGHQLSIEGGRPIHQRLEGHQLKADFFSTVSWQKTF